MAGAARRLIFTLVQIADQTELEGCSRAGAAPKRDDGHTQLGPEGIIGAFQKEEAGGDLTLFARWLWPTPFLSDSVLALCRVHIPHFAFKYLGFLRRLLWSSSYKSQACRSSLMVPPLSFLSPPPDPHTHLSSAYFLCYGPSTSTDPNQILHFPSLLLLLGTPLASLVCKTDVQGSFPGVPRLSPTTATLCPHTLSILPL